VKCADSTNYFTACETQNMLCKCFCGAYQLAHLLKIIFFEIADIFYPFIINSKALDDILLPSMLAQKPHTATKLILR